MSVNVSTFQSSVPLRSYSSLSFSDLLRNAMKLTECEQVRTVAY